MILSWWDSVWSSQCHPLSRVDAKLQLLGNGQGNPGRPHRLRLLCELDDMVHKSNKWGNSPLLPGYKWAQDNSFCQMNCNFLWIQWLVLLSLPLTPSSIWHGILWYMGFPGRASGIEPACQCRRCETWVSIPGLGGSPGGENGSPLQYSCLGNPMNRGATVESPTPKSSCTSLKKIPQFQFPLSNNWWITVFGVTKSDTGLSR